MKDFSRPIAQRRRDPAVIRVVQTAETGVRVVCAERDRAAVRREKGRARAASRAQSRAPYYHRDTAPVGITGFEMAR